MMKKYRNKKFLSLAAAALVLTAGVSAGKAMAYFTTYAEASGGAVLELGSTTTVPDETVSNWTKHVTIENTGDYECFVRVRAYAGAEYDLEYIPGEGWSAGGDGYYYYEEVLQPHDRTSELQIKIDPGTSTDAFDVIVVQEHTPVRYNEDGPYAQWTAVSGTESGTTDPSAGTGEESGNEGGSQG